MSRRAGTGAVPEIRAAKIAHLREFQSVMPGIFADQIEALESGAAVVLSSGTLFSAVYRINSAAARRYAYRTDPQDRRRFLLDEHDVLTELPRDNTDDTKE